MYGAINLRRKNGTTVIYIRTEEMGKILTLKLIAVNDTAKTNVLGFRDNNFSYDVHDTYRMIRPVITFRTRRIDKKCNNLPNFFAVTLRTHYYF
jgi:hypothetical protein